MKKCVKALIAAVLLIAVVSGCGAKAKNFYGTYCDVTTKSKSVAYCKDYMMMDCCEGWEELLGFVKTLDTVAAVEGYELYFYDDNGMETASEEHTVSLHPTASFMKRVAMMDTDRFVVYSLENRQAYDAVYLSASEVQFTTTEKGIFILAAVTDKKVSNKYISNPYCYDDCRTCAEE